MPQRTPRFAREGRPSRWPSLLVIGATNPAELLGEALLRPGRLGEAIKIALPDATGRKTLLEQKMHLAPSVDLENLAAPDGGGQRRSSTGTVHAGRAQRLPAGARNRRRHARRGRRSSTMVVEEATTYVDLLERVLDKGIVFDPWIRVSVAGIDLITVGTHVVVASIDTYLSSVAMSRVLFIVAADRPDLFEMWTAEFRDLAQGHGIVLDGRRAERRHQIQSVHKDRRRAERREHKINRELESVGLAVVATGLEGE